MGGVVAKQETKETGKGEAPKRRSEPQGNNVVTGCGFCLTGILQGLLDPFQICHVS